MSVAPDPRNPARHQAVHRGAVAGHPGRPARAVDRALAAGDVRLTMGGEPTFVSATDIDAPEWNTDALGPTKRAYAERLLRRLAPLWSPGAALQYGMGKQYPGEQLPRWALHCHWRADGEPVWRDPALLAAGRRHRHRHRRRRRAVRRRAGRAAAGRSGAGHPGLRGRPLLPVARAPAAGQRGRRGRQAARPAGTRAAGARVRPGPGHAGRQRAAAAPR